MLISAIQRLHPKCRTITWKNLKLHCFIRKRLKKGKSCPENLYYWIYGSSNKYILGRHLHLFEWIAIPFYAMTYLGATLLYCLYISRCPLRHEAYALNISSNSWALSYTIQYFYTSIKCQSWLNKWKPCCLIIYFGVTISENIEIRNSIEYKYLSYTISRLILWVSGRYYNSHLSYVLS